MRQYYLALRCHIFIFWFCMPLNRVLYSEMQKSGLDILTIDSVLIIRPHRTPPVRAFFMWWQRKSPSAWRRGFMWAKKYRVLSTFGSFRLITKWNTGNALKLRNVLINYFFNFVFIEKKKNKKSGLFVFTVDYSVRWINLFSEEYLVVFLL